MTYAEISRERPLRVLSLGAGVQSSTLALMSAAGEVPAFDVAIFADTQGEPQAVYDWLDWLKKQVPFDVHVVTKGSLWDSATNLRTAKSGNTYLETSIPVFTVRDGLKKGLGRRTCTADFKITPIQQETRRVLGLKRVTKKHGVLAEMHMGISLDECERMKPSREAWIVNKYPLIDARMTRGDCFAWMERHGYPTPPRSACTFCPFRSDAQWAGLTPEEFADAVEKEKQLQAQYAASNQLEGVPFLHRSCTPLEDVELNPKEENNQLNMFREECAGFCGT